TAAATGEITPETANAPPQLPLPQEGSGPGILAAQVLLDRVRFSPGVIDGQWGQNTEKAVYWFQFAHGLPPAGVVDEATWRELSRLGGGGVAVVEVEVTAADLEGPFVEIPEDVYDQAALDCLCYESPAELLAERHHAAPELLAELNPEVDLEALTAGTRLWVAAVEALAVSAGRVEASGQASAQPAGAPRVARLLISKRGFYTQALDAQGRILFHFPSTLGSRYDPSPAGQFRVTGIAFNPAFHYQPTLFHEVPDDQPEAHLPAGPNSPVGLVWMALSKPHHGIHGTAVPESIGYASSHGCVRLTNWDALFLARRIAPGVPVQFRD
ncbi:MAG: L,D-transpeptidase family protein, partial [Candidatus Rokuibacteriota bacterium]